MNKQDEEKARELSLAFQIGAHGERVVSRDEIRDACLKMSAWKEEQMIRNVEAFLKSLVPEAAYVIDENFIYRIKQAMMEE